MSLSPDVNIEGLNREEARNLLVKLPRYRQFTVHVLSDGRKVFIRTDGRKISKVNGKEIKDIDFTVHYDGEKRGLSYIYDVLLDIKEKEGVLGEEGVSILLNAIEDSIDLVPIDAIKKKYPKLKEFGNMGLKGHTIEFLLVILRWLGLQEDVNYWGIKFKIDPKTRESKFDKNGDKYEGREKPIHALDDLFIKKMPLEKVIRKNKL